MHFVFSLYGGRELVERVLRRMECQQHQLKLWKKEGNAERIKQLWIEGQIRQGPLGTYEYIFPKEPLDLVLNTMLTPLNLDRYNLGLRLTVLRKLLKLRPTLFQRQQRKRI